jgi:hypothetical protein
MSEHDMQIFNTCAEFIAKRVRIVFVIREMKNDSERGVLIVA